MKRDELLRRIRKAANRNDLDLALEREGANHSIFRCGAVTVVVPRHREINELTARGIMRDLEGQLGEGWWR